jgi:hypothetical protein
VIVLMATLALLAADRLRCLRQPASGDVLSSDRSSVDRKVR